MVHDPSAGRDPSLKTTVLESVEFMFWMHDTYRKNMQDLLSEIY